jgi:hypothetical protein
VNSSIFEIIVGAVLVIIMTILLEKLRKLKLELRIVSPIDVNFEKNLLKRRAFLD